MQHEAPPFQRKFLQFYIPGLENTGLAVPLSRVAAVTPQLPVASVPLTPEAIIGLCKWSEQIITVINLSVALDLNRQINNGGNTQTTFLIVKVVDENWVENIAWKILSNAQIIQLPAHLPAQDSPQLSNPACVVCQYHQVNLLLLDVDGLLQVEKG